MTLFLIEFDRTRRRLVRDPETFDESHRDSAFARRSEVQKAALDQGLDRDVVLVEAASLDDLRRTHGSFFATAEELGRRLGTA